MIDLHSHVLPGLDDGCADLSESVELARSLRADGVKILAATPHVRDDYPTTPETMQAALGITQLAIAEAGIDLQLVRGGEVALDRLTRLSETDLKSFALGRAARYLLVEFPYDGFPIDLADQITALESFGLTAILAHPERSLLVQDAPQRLAGLADAGVLLQVTAGSLTGAFGSGAAATAQTLIDSGLAHLIGGDAHRAGSRPTIARAVRHVPRSLATWLVEDVPAAVLAGDRPPARPSQRRRLRLLRR